MRKEIVVGLFKYVYSERDIASLNKRNSNLKPISIALIAIYASVQ